MLIIVYIKDDQQSSPVEELTTFLHLYVLIIASYYYCLQNFPNSPISFIACLFYTCYLKPSDLVVTTLYTLHIVIVTTFYLILFLSFRFFFLEKGHYVGHTVLELYFGHSSKETCLSTKDHFHPFKACLVEEGKNPSYLKELKEQFL